MHLKAAAYWMCLLCANLCKVACQVKFIVWHSHERLQRQQISVQEKPKERPEEELADASSMDPAEATAAAEAQAQAELVLKSSTAQAEVGLVAL